MRILLLLGVLIVVFCSPVVAQSTEAPFGQELSKAASKSLNTDIHYNGSYVSLEYPWGDVPETQGVCADVIVRAYRELGIDLQKRLHKDMKSDFAAYPSKEVWGLSRPDRNIDHRRVLNLEVFFARHGESLPVTDRHEDYLPGDIVAWNIPKYGGGRTPHIGIVSDQKAGNGRLLVIHHLSGAPKLEDVLFAWPQTGHYRYQVPLSARDR